MWRHWFEESLPLIESFEVLLKFGFDNPMEMNSAIQSFSQDQYFQTLNFKLKPINEYQGVLIGHFLRVTLQEAIS